MPLIRSLRGWDPHPLRMIPAPAETARLAQRHSLVSRLSSAAPHWRGVPHSGPRLPFTECGQYRDRQPLESAFPVGRSWRSTAWASNANAAPPADSSHPLSAPVLYRHRSFIDTGPSPSPKPFRRIERQSPTTPCVFTTELGQACDPRNALPALKAAAKKPGCLQRSGCTPRGALACLSHVVGWRAAQGGLGDLQFAQASRSLEAFMVTSRPMCLVRR